MKGRKSLWRIRTTWQTISFFIVNSYFLSPIGKYIPIPVFNCYSCPLASFACPIGTIQHFIVLHQIPFLTIGILVLAGLSLGRYFCGWLCPFGFVQDILYKIPTKKMHIENRFATLIRWGVLISMVIFIPYITLEPWFCKLCPAGTLEAGIPQVLLNPPLRNLIGTLFVINIAILMLFILLSIMISRPFCRFICPLGTILSAFNKVSYYHLEVSPNCTECNLCKKECPVNIEVYKDPNSPHCIRCHECFSCGKVRWKID
ncbi:MAG TPA: 4Fe-4S binding protein [Dictyoglomaceae bacterium]|nr:4Fe-4S binding protein [Dictyoglomaceae bacterium]